MTQSRTEALRIVGLGIAIAALSLVSAIAVYATLLPLQLSRDPTTQLVSEPRWYGPVCLSVTLALVTAGACFMVSGPRGARDGLRLGTAAGLTLALGWFALELSRGRSPGEVFDWSYLFVVVLLAMSGALASFARRRLSRVA
jgi:hypothetical protein